MTLLLSSECHKGWCRLGIRLAAPLSSLLLRAAREGPSRMGHLGTDPPTLIFCPPSVYWPLPAAGVSGSMVFCLENEMPHRLLGSATVHFHASEVQQLLHNKFVVILGDSSE